MSDAFQLERPLVAFRTWYTRSLVPQASLFQVDYATTYKPKPLALYPMTTEVPWTRGVNEATCHKDGRQTNLKYEHTSPHADCYCGLHAYVDPEHDKESAWITHLFDKELMVQGAVLMWGTIYGGKKVVRSEFAEVVAFLDDSPIAKLVAEQYHVPAVSEAHMIYLATEHGDRVSPELEAAIEAATKDASEDYPKDFPQTT